MDILLYVVYAVVGYLSFKLAKAMIDMSAMTQGAVKEHDEDTIADMESAVRLGIPEQVKLWYGSVGRAVVTKGIEFINRYIIGSAVLLVILTIASAIDLALGGVLPVAVSYLFWIVTAIVLATIGIIRYTPFFQWAVRSPLAYMDSLEYLAILHDLGLIEARSEEDPDENETEEERIEFEYVVNAYKLDLETRRNDLDQRFKSYPVLVEVTGEEDFE